MELTERMCLVRTTQPTFVSSPRKRSLRLLVCAAAGAAVGATSAIAQPLNLPAAPAGVQVTTSYGIEFSTFSAVGNPAIPAGGSIGFPRPYPGRGSITTAYRISRTEISAPQWVDFTRAYVQTFGVPTNPNVQIDIFGGVIDFDPQSGEIVVPVGAERSSVRCSWRTAAMFCNWLHNDRGQGAVQGAAAFASGAYDTSTFVTRTFPDPSGFPGNVTYSTDQLTRSPGARFWIPSLDEWMAAAFYNPAQPVGSESGWMRYVWNSNQYPNEPNGPGNPVGPRFGAPGTPGVVSSGNFEFAPIASYPEIQSPWGLLDLAGGVAEWTEFPGEFDRFNFEYGIATREAFGSRSIPNVNPQFEQEDHDRWGMTPFRGGPSTWRPDTGFRIAAVVPSPSALAVICASLGILTTRRRK